MLSFKKLKWSNVFSYGPDNEIDLSKYTLAQLIGKNGHGKSSIANILEELYFNTNSKKIARAFVQNRYYGNSYSIEGTFSKDLDNYEVKLVRTSSTTKLKLLKNNIDISSHTPTATYKTIQEIIGYSHKAFTQIIYQTSAFGLEFLTATDTKRKEFLIDLFNLSKYTEIFDIIKKSLKDTTEQHTVLSTKVNTINTWIDKYSDTPLTKMELLEVPEQLLEHSSKIQALETALLNIVDTNKRIVQNNKYKEILNSIVLDDSAKPTDININQLEVDIGVKTQELNRLTKEKTGLKLTPICIYCNQSINIEDKLARAEVLDATIVELKTSITNLTSELVSAKSIKIKYDQAVAARENYEKYFSLIDKNLDNKLIDEQELKQQKALLESEITNRNTLIRDITFKNRVATEHNTKIDVVLDQLKVMRDDLAKYSKELEVISAKLNRLQILYKAFSTGGLVAYKIESLIKDLEYDVNLYLSELSDGRFQISFQLNSSDKLNVVITDNGTDIDILALSNGERARVNVATLLAIRKVLQSMNDSKVNLLILDETIENLDDYGKEKLIEVLLNEQDLNTLLISHGFNHPLLEKIHVVKENNISRIL